MRVFISSPIKGMEAFREAAVRGARSLGHEVKRSEDFPALAESPQQACLAGVREADIVVLLLGERYGGSQESGLSATHEEYREARERRPVLAFVQEGVEMEPAQAAFADEVRTWQGGLSTGSFSTPDDLGEAVVRALHEFEMSRRAGEVDETEMLERAETLLPESRGIASSSLVLVVVGGPRQPVLRPSELEDPSLEQEFLRQSLVGELAVLSPAEGTSARTTEHAVLLEQRDASVLVDDLGSVRIVQPAREDDRTSSGLPVLIEEDVRDRLARALRLSGETLDRVDPVRRLREILPVVSLHGASFLGWRTGDEHARSPQSVQVPHVSDPQVVTLSPTTRPRASLLHETDALSDDFLSILRRRLRP